MSSLKSTGRSLSAVSSSVQSDIEKLSALICKATDQCMNISSEKTAEYIDTQQDQLQTTLNQIHSIIG